MEKGESEDEKVPRVSPSGRPPMKTLKESVASLSAFEGSSGVRGQRTPGLNTAVGSANTAENDTIQQHTITIIRVNT